MMRRSSQEKGDKFFPFFFLVLFFGVLTVRHLYEKKGDNIVSRFFVFSLSRKKEIEVICNLNLFAANFELFLLPVVVHVLDVVNKGQALWKWKLLFLKKQGFSRLTLILKLLCCSFGMSQPKK